MASRSGMAPIHVHVRQGVGERYGKFGDHRTTRLAYTEDLNNWPCLVSLT